MSDEAPEPKSGIPLHQQTIVTKKLLALPDQKPSSSDNSVNNVDGQKRKCGRKGRRKSGTKKHRAGRNQKRRYKPYYKLSVTEQQKVDYRNEKRNTRRREYYHSCGLSLAPPNTTQFLFQDNPETDLLLRKFEVNKQNFDENSDQSSMSEDCGSSSDSDEFMAMWERESRQRYQAMSIQQLIEHFLSLEDQLAEYDRNKEEVATKIRIFQEEVRNYEATNEVLSKLNAGLTKVLEDVHSKSENEIDKKDLPVEIDLTSTETV